jgi:hypothetical protein
MKLSSPDAAPAFGRYKGVVNDGSRAVAVQLRLDCSSSWFTLVERVEVGTCARPGAYGLWLPSKTLLRLVDAEDPRRVLLAPQAVHWSLELLLKGNAAGVEAPAP